MTARLHNRPALKPFRKALRNHGTAAEATLWTLLKGSQLEGRKFRRQHSVGSFILDFYCPAEALAVELDGAGHFTEAGHARDELRTAFLQAAGIRVVRFENRRVFECPDAVLAAIASHFRSGRG